MMDLFEILKLNAVENYKRSVRPCFYPSIHGEKSKQVQQHLQKQGRALREPCLLPPIYSGAFMLSTMLIFFSLRFITRLTRVLNTMVSTALAR